MKNFAQSFDAEQFSAAVVGFSYTVRVKEEHVTTLQLNLFFLEGHVLANPHEQAVGIQPLAGRGAAVKVERGGVPGIGIGQGAAGNVETGAEDRYEKFGPVQVFVKDFVHGGQYPAGAAPCGELSAQDRSCFRCHQGGTDVVAGNIRNHQVDAVVALGEVVVVAPHVGGGQAEPRKADPRDFRRCNRDKGELYIPRQFHLPQHVGVLQKGFFCPLPFGDVTGNGDTVQLLVECNDPDGDFHRQVLA